ncbi:TonB family protein [Mizugakiibacter sediminis]|uniref:TonB family protein n=1 Tax=Mizugakiibacter sediminis TaxID=1475481 RepID=A0A0K8QL01_9GAMM|nr:hypothetical protein [Mizugakiibacter sediminis]GAP65620.1 TonB family protein [Mizugakiibacter sediminis]
MLACAALLATAATAEAATRRVAPERLEHYWILSNRADLTADAPISGRNLDKPSCAAVSYTIGSDGATYDLKLERVVPPGDLGKVAMSLVANMRYAFAPGNLAREPVRTYLIVPFNLPRPPADASSAAQAEVQAERDRIGAACRLPGYGGPAG